MNALKENLSLFLKFSVKLGGISNVIDVLESSFKGSLSAKLHDLHHLQESILKTKQVSFPEILVKWTQATFSSFLIITCFYFIGCFFEETHMYNNNKPSVTPQSGEETPMYEHKKKLSRFTISLCDLH